MYKVNKIVPLNLWRLHKDCTMSGRPLLFSRSLPGTAFYDLEISSMRTVAGIPGKQAGTKEHKPPPGSTAKHARLKNLEFTPFPGSRCGFKKWRKIKVFWMPLPCIAFSALQSAQSQVEDAQNAIEDKAQNNLPGGAGLPRLIESWQDRFPM